MGKNSTSHHGFKTFVEALEASHLSSAKGKKYLQDKRLTFLEKKLLTSFLLTRENKFTFIQDLAKDSIFESSPFLNGIRHLILGSVLVYKAEAQLAEHHLEEAIGLLKQETNEKFVQRMLFKAHLNLYYAFVNQKKIKGMNHQFQKAISFLSDSKEDEISSKLMEVCLRSMQGEYPKAEELLLELEDSISQMNDIQRMSYFIEKFDFFVKIDSLIKANNVLKEMKKHRTFRLSACYQYMDRLLKFVMTNERIYSYDREFSGHEDLYLMINVIRCLEEADWDEAHFLWSKLAAKSPECYLPEFKYKGDKCLFSIALGKCLNKEESSPLNLEKTYTDPELKLISSIIESTGLQIKKENLFFAVYQREMTFKDDLIALSSIIYRINKKGELLIKSKKGSYFVASINLKKVS